VQEIISHYQPITLEEMDDVALMNRTDTKYLMSMRQLEEVLAEVAHHYRILDINGLRSNHYQSQYYDTPDFYFYRRHHSGKQNRLKIRKRMYVESNLTFLEVKFKSNKGRTEKDRTKLDGLTPDLSIENENYINEMSHFEEHQEPKLMNLFERITLVDQSLPERITIDVNLSFVVNDRTVDIPDLVIIEAKQERQNRHSVFLQALKKRLIRPESMSKYCLGVALLYPEMKSNNFKQKLLKIEKIKLAHVA
jgi:hypothetical protein